MSYTVPNWGQAVIAEKVGLEKGNVAVEFENDRLITFLQYLPRKRVQVSKTDGKTIVTQENMQIGKSSSR